VVLSPRANYTDTSLYPILKPFFVLVTVTEPHFMITSDIYFFFLVWNKHLTVGRLQPKRTIFQTSFFLIMIQQFLAFYISSVQPQVRTYKCPLHRGHRPFRFPGIQSLPPQNEPGALITQRIRHTVNERNYLNVENTRRSSYFL
jgi:hypothetical protein